MLIASAILLTLAVVAVLLMIRPADLPAGEPESPTRHLEDRKAAIYENLRDLSFEYRVGKLSDEDYKIVKQGLQGELAQVLAEIDRLAAASVKPAAAKATAPASTQAAAVKTAPIKANVEAQCPHCGAAFPHQMKFCGQCGRSMTKVSA